MDNLADQLVSARRGDRSALGDLLEAQANRLKRLARGRRTSDLRARMHTSDLVQDTLVDALNGFDRFDGSSEHAFRGWLVRILENNVVDSVRFHTAEKRNARRELEHSGLQGRALDPAPSPQSLLIQQNEMERIADAIERLPRAYREAIRERMARDPSQPGPPASGRDRMLLARARAALAIELRQSTRSTKR